MHAPPADWAQPGAWRVLDTGFGQGQRFFDTWQTWRQASARPRLLHYVALCGGQAPKLAGLQAGGAPAELIAALAPQWFGLLPGFHRLMLDGGQVLLTLCVGEPLAALREQAFLADAAHLHAPDWDLWHIKALAHLCRRGTQLTTVPLTEASRKLLRQCGFDITQDDGPQGLQARFNPRWTLKATQADTGTPPSAPSHCTVVGAGLAGASVAASLARRGVQVDVLDAAPHPSAQASGLPVGLMVPMVSPDDGTRARLSRAGLRLSLQQADTRLRRGEDWDRSGVLERCLQADAVLPAHWGEAGRDWSDLCGLANSPAPGLDPLLDQPALWHRAGAWVKPAALVRAWLATEGVRFVGNAAVATLASAGSHWLLRDNQGQLLAESSHVVLANAWGAAALAGDLLPQRPPLSAVHGQVSWGLHRPGEPALPPCPVNGMGSFVSQLPLEGQQGWYAGSTFEHSALPVDQAHQANLARLAQLLPDGASLLRGALADGSAQAWRNTRCTSTDRLPLVGRLSADPAPASLWISTAMGARGLSLSVLCAELLAAQLCGEPLPLEASLARLLSAQRGRRRTVGTVGTVGTASTSRTP